jgi:protein SCO1/2
VLKLVRPHRTFFRTLLAVAAVLGACRREPPPHRYRLSGRVVSVEAASKDVVVAHGDIAGYMPAMTMPFPLKDERLLAMLGPGDEISATLVTTRLSHWLEDVVVTRKSPAGDRPPAAPGAVRVEALAGEAVPDAPLVDEDGRGFRLADYRGRAYVVTFVFTRCPLADFCPRVSGLFAGIEKELSRDPALRARTRLLSISFDPEHDTPAVLRAYAKPFRGPGSDAGRHWDFATGKPEDIKALATFFGVDYEPDASGITHNLRTTVVGPEGEVVRVFRGSDWAAQDVLAALATIVPRERSPS